MKWLKYFFLRLAFLLLSVLVLINIFVCLPEESVRSYSDEADLDLVPWPLYQIRKLRRRRLKKRELLKLEIRNGVVEKASKAIKNLLPNLVLPKNIWSSRTRPGARSRGSRRVSYRVFGNTTNTKIMNLSVI